jgi:four helix bundle suffix protein
MQDGFIPPHGGYKKLKSYQKSVVVYDATLYFCDRFFKNNRRQTDQMEQAARSGKQNIAEGSLASATSKKTEIFLTNVARASLGELQEDYEDFLRNQPAPIWEKDHPTAIQITALSRNSPDVYETYRDFIEHDSPEVVANFIRHLILQTMYMLGRQIQKLEADFLENGGFRERMTAARLKARGDAASEDAGAEQAPNCPECGATMISRTARKGPNAGKSFWGCSKFPECRAIVNKVGES